MIFEDFGPFGAQGAVQRQGEPPGVRGINMSPWRGLAAPFKPDLILRPSGSRAFARPNLGPQNIESGLNGVAMPPFGLILSRSTATASGMPLGALGAPKRPQIYKKHGFSCFFGSLGGTLPLGIPIVPLRDAHRHCHSIAPFA